MSTEQFFNLTSHLLDDTQSNEIMDLFNNLQTFNYNDIFGNNDFSLTRPRIISAMPKMSLRKPKIINITKAVINSDKLENFYKVWCFHDDKYKDWWILLALKEVYFHNLYYNYLINNNIKDFTIPILYRHGLINNSTEYSTEYIFFIEMKKYDIKPLPNFIVDENTNQLQELIDYYTEFRDMIVTISNLNTGIHHNDHISPTRMNKSLAWLEKTKARIEHFGIKNFNNPHGSFFWFLRREVGENIVKLMDGTFMLLDFEHSSTIFGLHSYTGPTEDRPTHKVIHIVNDNIE